MGKAKLWSRFSCYPLLALLVALQILATAANAASTRMVIEGAVTQLLEEGNSPPSLPDGIAVGSTVVLDLRIESTPFPRGKTTAGVFASPGTIEIAQPFPISLSVGPVELHDEQGSVTLAHDPLAGVTPETTGDAILMEERIGLTAMGDMAGGGNLSWSIYGSFHNPGDALSGGEDLNTAAVWNAMSRRTLFVEFEAAPPDDSSAVVAITFGNARVVPEPNAVLQGTIAIVSMLVIRVRKRSPEHQKTARLQPRMDP